MVLFRGIVVVMVTGFECLALFWSPPAVTGLAIFDGTAAAVTMII